MDTSVKRTLGSVPLVSVLKRFDCTVEPPIIDHIKCKELVTYRTWSLTRVKLREVFYNGKSGCIYMYRVLSGENVLHVIVGLQFSAPSCDHFGCLGE